VTTQKRAPQEGELFAGKFRIERLLGQGGMGAVYLALHEGLRQRVAIKVLLGEIADSAEAVTRFKNEAQAAAGIQNDHVVRVTDVGETDQGLPYMIMEYLEGHDLAQLLEQRSTLPPAEAVDYVLQALEAIHQAHEARIVHRDLKPSNLFLARRADGSMVVKVLDFGISKVQSEQNGALTSTRSMLGSPLYMSPEQLRSSKTVDSRSDIWALGVILYELLTGTVPYVGEGLGELFAAILEQDPVPVRERNAAVDPGLEQVVMRCLRKKKEERWSSVAELAAALAPYAPQGKQGLLAMRVTQGLIQPAPIVPAPIAPIPAGTAMMAHGPGTLPSGAMPAGVPSGGFATTPGQDAFAPRPPMPSIAGQTGSASWATGSAGGMEVPKKPIGLLIGISVGAVLLIGAGIGGVALYKSKTPVAGTVQPQPSTTAAPTAPATIAQVPPPPTATSVDPQPSATTTTKVATNNVPPVLTGHRPNGLPTARPTATAVAVVPTVRPTATARPVATGGGGRFD